MAGIKGWKQGWGELADVLDALIKQAQEHKKKSAGKNTIGSMLVDDLIADLQDALNEARTHKGQESVVAITRALTFEEGKLEEWADSLDQRIPKLPPIKKNVANGWRDNFRREANLNRDLMSGLQGGEID